MNHYNFCLDHLPLEQLYNNDDIDTEYDELYKYTKVLEEYIKNHTSHRILICPKCGKLFPYGFGCICGYDYQPDRAYIEITGFKETIHEYILFEKEVTSLDDIDHIIPWNIIFDYVQHFNIKFNTNVSTVDDLKNIFHNMINYITESSSHTGISNSIFHINTDFYKTSYKIKISAKPNTYN